MRRTLRLLPRVEAELSEAIEWYEARRAGLGAELLEAAARAFVRIQEAPHQLARWRVGRREPGFATPVRERDDDDFGIVECEQHDVRKALQHEPAVLTG